MFGNRQRKARDGKQMPAFLTPAQESNSGGRAAATEVDDTHSIPNSVLEVMSVVKLNWEFMTLNEFNAIPYALSLLDESSVGSDYNRFLETSLLVDNAMELIVNGEDVLIQTIIMYLILR